MRSFAVCAAQDDILSSRRGVRLAFSFRSALSQNANKLVVSFPARVISTSLLQPSFRSFLLLFFGCLFFHLAGTWNLPLLERAEPRFAEASREMNQRRDYVVPFFNNNYRFDKPPLAYWAQAISYRLLGEHDFAARFPSAVAAAFVSVLLLLWGIRLSNARIGWTAAVVFTLSAQVFIYAKACIADMWLVFFVALAHYAAFELLGDSLGRSLPLSPGRRRLCWWLFYLALALGFLAKGPIALVPLLTLAGLKFVSHEKQFAKLFSLIPGLLLVVALVALWAVPAMIRTEGEFLRVGIGHHVIDRSLAPIKGQGAKSFGGYLLLLPFYFITIFFSFFPWSWKLPWLSKRLWRKRDPLDQFLLLGMATVFLIFTFFKTKLPHYTLPAFPLLALLFARHLEEAGIAKRLVRRTAFIILPIYALLAFVVAPLCKPLFPTVQILEAVRSDLRRDMEFGAVDYLEPSVVWYFRRYVDNWLIKLEPNTVDPFMQRTGPRFVILPTALAQSLYANLPAGWKTYTRDAFYGVKGQRISLTVILKPE